MRTESSGEAARFLKKLIMNSGPQDTYRKSKSQLLLDTEALAVMLDDLQNYYTHRYKYGYGNDIQHLLKDMLECYHASQILVDFNQRSLKLQVFLYKLDTLFSLLELLSVKCGLPDDKLNLIYRQTDKIAKHVKGLRSYFASQAGQNQVRR